MVKPLWNVNFFSSLTGWLIKATLQDEICGWEETTALELETSQFFCPILPAQSCKCQGTKLNFIRSAWPRRLTPPPPEYQTHISKGKMGRHFHKLIYSCRWKLTPPPPSRLAQFSWYKLNIHSLTQVEGWIDSPDHIMRIQLQYPPLWGTFFPATTCFDLSSSGVVRKQMTGPTLKTGRFKKFSLTGSNLGQNSLLSESRALYVVTRHCPSSTADIFFFFSFNLYLAFVIMVILPFCNFVI